MENSKNKGRLLKNYKKSFKTNIKYEWKQYIHVCKEYKNWKSRRNCSVLFWRSV